MGNFRYSPCRGGVGLRTYRCPEEPVKVGWDLIYLVGLQWTFFGNGDEGVACRDVATPVWMIQTFHQALP